MANDRAAKVWGVNVVSFILLVTLVLTGLVNWFFLPRGYAAAGSALATLRHFLRDVHAWTAVLFMISMLIHWALHWNYIQAGLKRYKRK